MSPNGISIEVKALKEKVKEIIGEVNALKTQLEKREICLEDFREKKELFENELRGILDKISQYKEKGTDETKKDAFIAEEAKRLMYEFQTEFFDYVSKPKVYLSASLADHFIFNIDFTNYPEKPKLIAPPMAEKLYDVPFETKLSILNNWSPQNPSHITEIFYEIENIFLKIFQTDETEELNLNQTRIQKILLRRRLLDTVEYELELKNNQEAIDLYQQIVEISYDLEDYEHANKYSKIIAELKKKLENEKT